METWWAEGSTEEKQAGKRRKIILRSSQRKGGLSISFDLSKTKVLGEGHDTDSGEPPRSMRQTMRQTSCRPARKVVLRKPSLESVVEDSEGFSEGRMQSGGSFLRPSVRHLMTGKKFQLRKSCQNKSFLGTCIRNHIVLVVDNSGSMRNRDIIDEDETLTRSQAVYRALGKTLFGLHDDTHQPHVVSLIEMGNDAEVVFVRRKLDEHLRQELEARQDFVMPRFHGNYIPALAKLRQLVVDRQSVDEAICVLFLSDGRPSDQATNRLGEHIVCARFEQLVECIEGARGSLRGFQFYAIGFGGEGNKFQMLKRMVGLLPPDVGVFSEMDLDMVQLSQSLSTFTTSIATTTASYVARSGHRRLRSANREGVDVYKDAVLYKPPKSLDGDFALLCSVDVTVQRVLFDHGGQRNVFQAEINVYNEDDLSQDFQTDIDLLLMKGNGCVAKESRYMEEDDWEFHKKNLVAQFMARELVHQFNNDVTKYIAKELPKVRYLKGFLCVTQSNRILFIEERIAGLSNGFQKWNTNAGHVKAPIRRQRREEQRSKARAEELRLLDGLMQTFTHWSYHRTQSQHMVCDVQGTFLESSEVDGNAVGSCYVLSDPVIHSAGAGKRFGTTDRGSRGMLDFFRTHRCNATCRALSLPEKSVPRGGSFKRAGGSSSVSGNTTVTSVGGSSVNTSEFTVVRTGHLERRKAERCIRTRQLQEAVKHGRKKRGRNGAVTHDHNGLRYVEAAKVGITAFWRSSAAD